MSYIEEKMRVEFSKFLAKFWRHFTITEQRNGGGEAEEELGCVCMFQSMECSYHDVC